MAPLLIGALIGAGLGLLKGQAGAKKNEEQDRYRKQAMLYSPWTGMGDVGGGTAPGMTDSIISGAAGGAMIGNMYKSAPSAKNAMEASDVQEMGGTAGAVGAESGASPEIYGKSLGGNLMPNFSTADMMDQANILGGVDYARGMNPYLNFNEYDFKPR